MSFKGKCDWVIEIQTLRQENSELVQEKAVLCEKIKNQQVDALGISIESLETIPAQFRNIVIDVLDSMPNFEIVEGHLECTHCRDHWKQALLKKQPEFCVSVNSSTKWAAERHVCSNAHGHCTSAKYEMKNNPNSLPDMIRELRSKKERMTENLLRLVCCSYECLSPRFQKGGKN